MAFRVINPGFAEITLPHSSYHASTIENELFNPINGISFTMTETSDAAILIPLPAGFSDHLYCKFSFYTSTKSISAFRMGVFQATNTNNLNWIGGLRGDTSNNKPVLKFYSSASSKGDYQFLNLNSHNSIWFHMLNEAIGDANGNGLYEIIINDNDKYSYNDQYCAAFNTNYKYFIISLPSNVYISNLIISDEYINPKEQVILLPTNSIDTDMTNNLNGSFTSDQENQYILQSIDTSDLISQFGAKSKVTGISNIAVPAYKSASGLSNLISIEQNNNQIIEHYSCAVSDDSLSGVSDCWNIDCSISDLNGKKFGWKAAM